MKSKTPPHFNHNNSLRNHFLVAMPCLEGSYFSHTVTYICDHNEHGAMGVVINQPTDISMTEVLEQLSINHESFDDAHPVLAGGPVNQHQGLVIHRSKGSTWKSSLQITSDIAITASKDIITAMANNEGPSGSQLVLGYAGWGPGQLEDEIIENSWLTVAAEDSIIFDTPVEHRWSATAKHLGIDPNLIPDTHGHA